MFNAEGVFIFGVLDSIALLGAACLQCGTCKRGLASVTILGSVKKYSAVSKRWLASQYLLIQVFDEQGSQDVAFAYTRLSLLAIFYLNRAL